MIVICRGEDLTLNCKEIAPMTKRQFSLLLGLVGQAGCVIYDDALHREATDIGADAAGDGAVAARDADTGTRADGVMPEADATRDAVSDVGLPSDARLGDDSSDATNLDVNGADGDDASDGSGSSTDVTSSDGSLEAGADAGADTSDGATIDTANDRRDAVDAMGDPPIVGCTVDFTVSGVTWDGGIATEDGGMHGVHLVGDVGQLGAWSPDAGRAMTEKAPGAWSTSISLSDRLVVEFKFVKVRSGAQPEWEQWPPFDSNRSLLVDCGADGGTVWVDAATEAGPASRAVGRSYGGAFGVRPLDATK
jgi:hypothetical protein